MVAITLRQLVPFCLSPHLQYRLARRSPLAVKQILKNHDRRSTTVEPILCKIETGLLMAWNQARQSSPVNLQPNIPRLRQAFTSPASEAPLRASLHETERLSASPLQFDDSSTRIKRLRLSMATANQTKPTSSCEVSKSIFRGKHFWKQFNKNHR